MVLAVINNMVPPAMSMSRLKVLLRMLLFFLPGLSRLSSSMVTIARTAQAMIP